MVSWRQNPSHTCGIWIVVTITFYMTVANFQDRQDVLHTPIVHVRRHAAGGVLVLLGMLLLLLSNHGSLHHRSKAVTPACEGEHCLALNSSLQRPVCCLHANLEVRRWPSRDM